MRTFALFHHPERGFEIVKQGFCWPAAVFGPFWAYRNKFRLAALCLAVAYLFCIAIAAVFLFTWSLLLLLLWFFLVACIAAFVGAAGNVWVINRLQDGGYRYITRRQAHSPADLSPEDMMRSRAPRRSMAPPGETDEID